MRKVVTYHLLSMDGVAEEPGDWLFSFDDQAEANLARIIAMQDTVLLGRNSYDEWAGYWPTSDVQPFADFINNTHKHVFTHGELGTAWQNTTAVSTSAADYVRELKARDGNDIGIHASIELSQSLMRAGVVDEIRLVIAPTVAGSGRRLFRDNAELQKFELIDCARSDSGLVLAGYRVAAPTIIDHD